MNDSLMEVNADSWTWAPRRFTFFGFVTAGFLTIPIFDKLRFPHLGCTEKALENPRSSVGPHTFLKVVP